MSEHTILFPEITRDGTSQAARFLPALNPNSVLVDERSLRDLLSFAREYGKELLYFNADNQAMGDWSAFIGDDLDLNALVSFMRDPATVSEEQREQFSRPHLSLFLSFLSLLQKAQTQLNTLTQRHLDFYYQEVLHMQKKAGVPDRVNILLNPLPRVDEARVPAGTAVNAGPDAIGKDRIYETDEDLIVNQAQILTLSSVFSEKETTGFKEARESKKGTEDERFVQMLEIALGDPLPGDPLPQNQILSGTDADVDFSMLTALEQLTAFSEAGLFMPLFELRSLMKFKRQRDDSSEEWAEINAYLESAARQKRGNLSFVFNPVDPRDFDANLIAALEGAPDYGGLTEVTTIDHIYTQRDREDVEIFIRDQLYFENRDDFLAMMRLKLKIDNEWDAVNDILQAAGRLKQNDNAYLLKPSDRSDFLANLNESIGPLASPLVGRFQDVDAYYEAIEALERDFYMSAERFSYLMQVGLKDIPSTWDWLKVDETLLAAYQDKVVSKRQAILQVLRETEGLTALLHFALGESSETAESNPLGRLSVAITNNTDTAFLEDISLREDSGDVSGLEWQKLYGIVEVAQRFFDNFVLGTPLKEQWINLFPAADARTVSSQGVSSDTPRWLTFGDANPDLDAQLRPEPILGWAMSSPLFALSEGLRVITLTFAFDPETFFLEKLQALFPEMLETTSGSPSQRSSSGEGPFQVDISGEKGWITPDSLAISWGSYAELTQTEESDLQAMQLTLSFSASLAAIAVFSDADVPSLWPLLRIKLRQIWDDSLNQFVTQYAPLRALQLLKTHVVVDVSGLRTIQLENDQSTLNAKKPFEPFARRPSVGSQFYIGHPELFQKRLDVVGFQIEWMGVPSKLEDHYRNYGLEAGFVFEVEMSLLDRRVNHRLDNLDDSDKGVSLFKSMDAADTLQTVQIPSQSELDAGTKLADLLFSANGFQYERDLSGLFEGSPSSWQRVLRWELKSPDFQHDVYSSVSSTKSLELSAAIANRSSDETTSVIDPSLYQVNGPYTPKIKELSLSYRASLEVVLEEASPENQDQIFHVHPFGYCALNTENDSASAPFLPQYNYEGELYIGITGLKLPQQLSLLFQMAEGSADPDLVPANIDWHVLSGNQWRSLQDGNILSDTTRGLINSGIMRFALEAVEPNTLLPTAQYWIRAAITSDSKSVCETVAIHTQAVSAVFVDTGNDIGHLSSPLAADSIGDLAKPLAGITGVTQPYTSFGGKAPEADDFFYTRVSERLRHKQRAVTFWDYEHLVLEHFPEIYKVKCLPASLATLGDHPGGIDLVVIPEIRNKLPFNPFEPKAPADLIAAISEYLSDKHPPWAQITVKNAHYVAVKARFGVRFKNGVDVLYSKKILNEALNRFLSPWAYDEGADIVIGEKIYANSIINFLDQQEDVDYVVEMKLFSSENGLDFTWSVPIEGEGYAVSSDRPDTVLVSALDHEIDLISDTGYEQKSFEGLNYMKLELDFIVG